VLQREPLILLAKIGMMPAARHVFTAEMKVWVPAVLPHGMLTTRGAFK
jgi:hypothetical protein